MIVSSQNDINLNAIVQSDAVAEAAASARAWLETLLRTELKKRAPRLTPVFQTLLGLWLCDNLDAGAIHRHQYRAAAAEVARILEDHAFQLDYRETSATLKILIAILLRRTGEHVSYLEEYLSRTADMLEQLDTEGSHVEIAVLEKKVLLCSAGLLGKRRLIDWDYVLQFASELELPADEAVINAVAVRVEAYTGWGTRRIEVEQKCTEWLVDLLRGFAVDAFRRYDLMTGCRLWRALSYLEAEQSTTMLRDFVLLHHHIDGAFGILGPEISALRRVDPHLDIDTGLYLPVTIECLWGLLDSHFPQLSLYGSLSRK